MSELDLYHDDSSQEQEQDQNAEEAKVDMNVDLSKKINPMRNRLIRTRMYTASYYQHQAGRTLIDKPDFELEDHEVMILWNAIGLAGEVGEVVDKIKKVIFHRHSYDKLLDDDMKKELGDVCWYLAALCTKLGFDLGDVMYGNIEKLKIRFPSEEGYRQEQTIVGKRLDEVGEVGKVGEVGEVGKDEE